jgi:hypothetical protein
MVHRFPEDNSNALRTALSIFAENLVCSYRAE